MTSELLPYDAEMIPPDMLMLEGHPANDQYLKNQTFIEKQIVAHSNTMSPIHVQIVKNHHKGMNNTEIAQKTGYSTATVSKVIKSEKGRRLKSLLAFYQHGIDGPNAAQRKNMLWRMAIENEQERPTVSKECIAELNRMDNSEFDRESLKQGNNNQVTIVIADGRTIQKGALDV